MSNQNHTPKSGNAPVERFSDGAVKASIFRNVSKEGKPFYNVTFARTYTHPETGQPAETQSFSGTDVLKVRRLADQAYHAVDRLRKQDRIQANEHSAGSPSQSDDSQKSSLSEQRDRLINNARHSPEAQDISYDRTGPEMER